MYNQKPSSPTTSFLPSNKTVDLPNDDEEQLHRFPTLSEVYFFIYIYKTQTDTLVLYYI